MELTEQQKQGTFYESIFRSSSSIKRDRGEVIAEDLKIFYKRAVEDQEQHIRTLQRDLKKMLDLSPDNSYTFVKPDTFNAPEWVKTRLELLKTLRNAKVLLEEYILDYNELLGENYGK